MNDNNRDYQPIPEPPYNQDNRGKIQPSGGKKSLMRLILIGLSSIIVLLLVLVYFLVTKPQSTKIVVVTPTVSTAHGATSQPGVTVTTVSDTPAALLTATVTPVIQPMSGLPCVVNISSWVGGSPDWVVHNGVLYNDGTNGNAINGGPTIIAPCQPGTANYAVEAKIQVTNPSSGCFGLSIRGISTQNGWQGYKTDVCGLETAYISAYGDSNPLQQAPFVPGQIVHTYRAEVNNNSIKFFIDGNLVDTATDNRLLTSETGEGVGLYSNGVQLQVMSFQVTALP